MSTRTTLSRLAMLSLLAALPAMTPVRADVLPPGKKPLQTVLKVQGLSHNGTTKNGSQLVLVVRSVTDGSTTVTQVLNNTPISKGYKFNSALLFFVSAKLLNKANQDITAIDYSKAQDGLSEAAISVPGAEYVDSNSPLTGKTIIYKLN